MPHITPDYYHFGVSHIPAESPKALKILINEYNGEPLDNWDFWVPKSVIIDVENYKEGDKDCTMCIRGWWVEQQQEFIDHFNL